MGLRKKAPCSCNNWSALDREAEHPLAVACSDERPNQEAVQKSKTTQLSDEFIYIKDSCDVEVNSTDTKVALSLQAALQAAILVVIRISITDSDTADRVTQELLNSAKVEQITRQKTIVENSRNVKVTTTDTQAAINIQVLIQLLLALVVELEIV
jgi:spore coat protein X